LWGFAPHRVLVVAKHRGVASDDDKDLHVIKWRRRRYDEVTVALGDDAHARAGAHAEMFNFGNRPYQRRCCGFKESSERRCIMGVSEKTLVAMVARASG